MMEIPKHQKYDDSTSTDENNWCEVELLANKASLTLDAMQHHQEMKEPDLKTNL